jgi:hypothetical protein
MIAIWAIIKGLAGNAIIQYVGIGLVALGALAWIRADARAPYKAEIVDLRKAAETSAKISAEDAKKQLEDAEESERERANLRDIIASLKTGACRPDPQQLKRLRGL